MVKRNDRFITKKWRKVIDCLKMFLYLHRSNKKTKKNIFKMTMCNLHITMTMMAMRTMMTTSTMMTPRG